MKPTKLKPTWLLKTILIFLAVLFVVASIFAMRAEAATPYAQAEVLRVIDGDTLVVSYPCPKNKKEMCPLTLRLVGVDAPELGFFGKVAECGGYTAKEQLELAAVDLAPYVLFRRQGIDKYGRTLVYLYQPISSIDPTVNGRLRTNSINYYLIVNGYAKSYRRFPHRYSSSYNQAEKFAKNGRFGLWNEERCPNP